MAERSPDHDASPEPSWRAMVELVPDLVSEDPVDVAVTLRERYGHVVRVPPFHPALDTGVYLVSHPDDVQRILQTEPSKFGPLDVPGADDFGNVIEDSVVSLSPESDGGSWLQRTRMLSPEFDAASVAEHAPEHAETTLATLAEFVDGRETGGDPGAVPEGARVWSDGGGVRLLPAMRRLTLRLLGVSLFGDDVRAHETAVIDAVDTLRTEFKRRRLHPVASRVSRHVPDELHLPQFLRGQFGDPSLTLRGRQDRTQAAVDELASVADRIVARRERTPLAFGDGLETWLVRPDPVTGETLSPATLRREVVGLLVAGHATTSAALTWAFYLLADRPDVQEQIRQEARETGLLAPLETVQERAREGDGDGQVPAASGEEFLDSLPFTRRVWREVLRLYPTLPMFGRAANEPVTLGGVDVPEGAQVLVSPYVTQRDPAFWSDPERFDPDRFRPERAKQRHEFAYFPFSGGRHACLGEHVAKTEAVTVLATTLATHRVEFARGAEDGADAAARVPDVGVDSAINLQPDRDIVVRFVPRDGE